MYEGGAGLSHLRWTCLDSEAFSVDELDARMRVAAGLNAHDTADGRAARRMQGAKRVLACDGGAGSEEAGLDTARASQGRPPRLGSLA